MLVGRSRATARTLALLDSASKGRGGALLLVGEKGSGRSAMIASAAQKAKDIGFRAAIVQGAPGAQSFSAVVAAFRELGLALEPAGRASGKIEALLLASADGFRLYTGGRGLEVSYAPGAGPGSAPPERNEETSMPDDIANVVDRLMRAPSGKRASLGAGDYRVAAVRGKEFAAAGILRAEPTEADFLDLEVVLDIAERRFLGGPRPGAGERDQWLEEELNGLLGRRESAGTQDLYRQAKRLLKLGTYRQPVLLAFDQIDQVDAASRRLIGYLARGAEEMKAAFILTSTPGPAERELAAAAPRVVLEPLGAKEMPDLAAELFGRVVAGPRFFDRLQRVSGGLPGKAAQWLIHLSKNGALKRRGEKHVEVPGVEWGTPPGIQQSLVGPLGGLPPEQRRILDAAAIVGVEFTTTPVAVLTGSSVHRAEQGLATLEARGLIVSDGVGYAFVDPAMRESLRDLVPEAERRDLCRRLAEFLAGTDGDDEQVALHFWEARDPLAIPRLERLVRRALGRDDVDLAHDLATRLDSLLPEARRWEGQAIIGEVLERRGNFTEAARCYIEASRAAGSRRIPLLLDAARAHQKERAAGKAGEVADRVLAESRDERERAVAQLYRLSALEEQGRLDEARSALDEAAAVFEKLQDVTMIGRAHHARGLLQYHAARAEDALAEFIKARQYGLAAGSHEDSAKACNNLAITYRLLGDTERAFAMQWEAVRSFQRIGDAGTAAACYHNLAWFYMDAGDFGASAASFRQSLDLCELSGIPGREAVPLSGLAGLEHARGNLKEALELTRRGLELRERLGWTDLMPDELASYAMRLIDIGDIAGAREVATRALVHEHRLSPMAVGPELAMGAVHLAAGEVDEAERTFRKALDGALAAKVVDMEYHARLRLAEILAARGAADGSVAEAEKALELVKDAGHRAQLPHAYRILGVARLGAGDLAGAGMALELGLDLAEEMGERLDRARCERDLAEVDLRSGRREAGMERLISAAGAFTQIGAIPDLERTKTLLGKAL